MLLVVVRIAASCQSVEALVDAGMLPILSVD